MQAQDVAQFDSNGFAVFQSGSLHEQCDDRDHDCCPDILPDELEGEWTRVIDGWLKYRNGAGAKLSGMVRKAVPSHIRPLLWRKLLDSDSMRDNSLFHYQGTVDAVREELVRFGVTEYNTVRAEEHLARVEVDDCQQFRLESAKQNLLNIRQIFLDVGRTFPTHRAYFADTPAAIEGRATLFRILAAYARFNPGVGYCQGMSFIAGTLALILPEEDAFWCLVGLLEKPKYLLGYFDRSLTRVQRHARIFDRLLQKRSPDLWSHLRRHKVDPLMYVTPWFMCLFTSLPGWDVVLRVWDLMLLEGVVVIFRTALAILELLRPALLATLDVNLLILLLQKPPADSIKKEKLLPVILSTGVRMWEISSIQAMIEETEERDGRPADASIGPAATTTWKSVRRKQTARSPSQTNRGSTTLLKKISGYFSGHRRKIGASDAANVSPNPQSSNSNAALAGGLVNEGRDEPIVDSPYPDPQKRVLPRCRKRSRSRRTSINEDCRRIGRLLAGGSGQFHSSESLGRVVDAVVGGVASQRMAFEEFSHGVPPRENRRDDRNPRRRPIPASNSETELKSMTDGSTGIKRRRTGEVVPGFSRISSRSSLPIPTDRLPLAGEEEWTTSEQQPLPFLKRSASPAAVIVNDAR